MCSTGSCSGWLVAALVACACASLCLDACLAAAAAPRDSRTYSRYSVSSAVYCGSRLSDALKFMCNGQYNSYFKTKKPADSAGQYRGRREAAGPEEEYWTPPPALPFRDRLRAAALLENHRRVTRGVFDECCSKSCTIDELMNYCDGPDD
ncbi:LIRP protein [Frankliniella fusca]|uniref:LIRP protein n=1 Tax=Frankliniella fusca TaxID=407009 RepID=A0AAE1GY59_9NEOP|nr:LIRP protein [Frankliniella fusca]